MKRREVRLRTASSGIIGVLQEKTNGSIQTLRDIIQEKQSKTRVELNLISEGQIHEGGQVNAKISPDKVITFYLLT